MRMDEGSWAVLDELVEQATEDLGAASRRRYERAAAHLLAVLTSDELPGVVDSQHVRVVLPALVDVDRMPVSTPLARTYLVLVGRLADRLGAEMGPGIATAREHVEIRRAERPPDARATRIPARLLRER